MTACLVVQQMHFEGYGRGFSFKLKGEMLYNTINLLGKEIENILSESADNIHFLMIDITKSNDNGVKANRLVELSCFFKDKITALQKNIKIFIKLRDVQFSEFPNMDESKCFDYIHISDNDYIPTHEVIESLNDSDDTMLNVNNLETYAISHSGMLYNIITIFILIATSLSVLGLVASFNYFTNTITGFIMFYCSSILLYELFILYRFLVKFKLTIKNCDLHANKLINNC